LKVPTTMHSQFLLRAADSKHHLQTCEPTNHKDIKLGASQTFEFSHPELERRLRV
jgi:hypothetical protein